MRLLRCFAALLGKFEDGMQTGSSDLEQQRKERLIPLKRAVSELRGRVTEDLLFAVLSLGC